MTLKRLWPDKSQEYKALPPEEQGKIWDSWYRSLEDKGMTVAGGYLLDDTVYDPTRPPIYDQSSVVYFLAPDRRTVWGINILTAAEALFEAAFQKACDVAYSRSPERDSEDFLSNLEEIEGDGDEKFFVFPEEEADPKLDGLTRSEFIRREARWRAAEAPPAVYEQVVVAPDEPGTLPFAIIVIDRPYLDTQAVRDAVERLHLCNYQTKIETTPVPGERLPKGDRDIMFLLFRKENPHYEYGPWGHREEEVLDILKYVDMSLEEYCALVKDRRSFQVAATEAFVKDLSDIVGANS